jgi:Type II CAAX prenyl endopeptidase Rce1-like
MIFIFTFFINFIFKTKIHNMPFSYIISPHFRVKEEDTIKNKLLFLLYSYLVLFVFFLISLGITKVLDFSIVHFLGLPSIEELVHANSPTLKKEFGIYYFGVAVIFVPFLEELIFRFPLALSRNSIATSFSMLAYKLMGGSFMKVNIYDYHSWLSIFLALSLFLLIRQYLSETMLTKIKTKHFKFIFYLSATLFALVHIQNFAIPDWRLYVFYPIYVLPQFFMGLFFGNIRMKYGFFWGWMLHGLVNLPSVFT